MIYLLYTVHVLICLFLILVVLLQQGKGADLSVFGGGGTMTAFGARGAATLLHKMTVFGFVGFILTTLAIGILQKQASGGSVMSGVPTAEEVAPATQDDAEAADAEEAAGGLLEDDAALPADEAPPAEDADEILPETETFDEDAADAAETEEGGGS